MKEKKKTLNNTGRILMSSTLSKKNTNAKKNVFSFKNTCFSLPVQ